MIGWIVLGVVVLALLYFIAIYNRLVRLRALVKEGFSGITVQLRRRADLIPNLVESVQGYATHEREVFEEVSRVRAATMSAGVTSKATFNFCSGARVCPANAGFCPWPLGGRGSTPPDWAAMGREYRLRAMAALAAATRPRAVDTRRVVDMP